MTFNLKDLVVKDCEVYPNYFLVAFKSLATNKTVTIEVMGEKNCLSKEDKTRLWNIMSKRFTFGFNSRNYDLPIIFYALKGKTCEEIHAVSQDIIQNNLRGWQVMAKYMISIPDHIKFFDLQEPAPGVRVSLKLYGGRLHSRTLRDLPIEPGTILTEIQMDDTKNYCKNDLDTTIDLFYAVQDRIKLRFDMAEKYGSLVLSRSDAQIAETVIKHELQKKIGRRIKAPEIPKGTKYRYKVPGFIKFKTKQLQDILEQIREYEFSMDEKGSIKLPDKLKKTKFHIGKSVYQMGVGGLHSNESARSVIPAEDEYLIDKDVVSYYPTIILRLKLYPKHLGEYFLEVYKNILDQRIKAKKEGNKVLNESLKIVVNGSFGKFGNKYSVLYSPDLMMTVTITGQLLLLMLIEELELNDIRVMSANTDGFVSLLKKDQYKLYDDICFNWELNTGFELEETRYKALYSANVNNYFAVSESGKTKGKGIFNVDPLSKNPATPIIVKAVEKYLVEGVEISKTIRECKDVRQFLHVRSVTGGAIWNDKYLGRVVRWIYSTKGKPIVYKKVNKKGTQNKVPKSEKARPIMILGSFPEDIDYSQYISESVEILQNLGLANFLNTKKQSKRRKKNVE